MSITTGCVRNPCCRDFCWLSRVHARRLGGSTFLLNSGIRSQVWNGSIPNDSAQLPEPTSTASRNMVRRPSNSCPFDRYPSPQQRPTDQRLRDGIGCIQRSSSGITTIQKTAPEEALFIVGHELGHYVSATCVRIFWPAPWVSGGAVFPVSRFALGAGPLAKDGNLWTRDWASLAVLLLLLHVLLFVASPPSNGFSRMQEHARTSTELESDHGLVPNSEKSRPTHFRS